MFRSGSPVEQGPAVVDIPTAPTIGEGLKTFGNAGLPFIVRGLSAFELDYDRFKERATKERLTTNAWNKRLMKETDILISRALEDWERGDLLVNFLDSQIPKLVPNNGIHKDCLDIGVDEDHLMLTLSNQGTYTPFHQDPIAGENSGAGWMWLLIGAKRWHFLTNDHSDAIFDPATNALNDFPTEDLVRADGCRLWGKVMKVDASAGDFLYIPPGCTHRVWTDKASFGVTGYLRRSEDDERISKAIEWYKKVGQDPTGGIYQLDRRALNRIALLETELPTAK
eukprot:Em0007g634a